MRQTEPFPKRVALFSTRHFGWRGLLALCVLLPMLALAETLPTPDSFAVRNRSFMPAVGNIRAVMIFVDFSSLPAGLQRTEASSANLLGNGRFNDLFYRHSQAKLALHVEAVHGWRRMPLPVEAYKSAKKEGAFTNLNTLLLFIKDVRKLFPDVDFARYPIVYIVSPNSTVYRRSQTASYAALTQWLGERSGESLDKLRNIVSIAGSAQSQRRPWMSLAHETAHVFGLPDLYIGKRLHKGKPWRIVWDLMEDIYRANGFVGWHSYMLGWLDRKRVVMPRPGTHTEYLLTPIRSGAGLGMLLLPLAKRPEKYLVIEIAEPITPLHHWEGLEPWGAGVLAYTVRRLPGAKRWQLDVYPVPRAPPPFNAYFTPPQRVGSVLIDPNGRFRVSVNGRVGEAWRVEVKR